MSQAIAIGGKAPKKPASTVPQSLPANFYRGYVPPATPKINPLPSSIMEDLPSDLFELPKASKETVGLNLDTVSYSLKDNKHPMSLPVSSGGFMAGVQLKNRVPITNTNNNNISAVPISEIKEDDPTTDIASGVGKMQIGSFTALQLMGGSGGDNLSMSSFADQSDLGSDHTMNQQVSDSNNQNGLPTIADSNDTMASAADNNNNNDTNIEKDPLAEEDDEDDPFEME